MFSCYAGYVFLLFYVDMKSDLLPSSRVGLPFKGRIGDVFIVILSGVIIGGLIIIFANRSDIEPVKKKAKEINTPDQKDTMALNRSFLNPMSLDENYNAFYAHEVKGLKEKVQEYIDQAIKSGQISEASVYIRDLTNSLNWMVNPEVTYSPASLMKVPIMMALLKHVETHPNALMIKMKYEKSQQDNFTISSAKGFELKSGLTNGKEYTIEHLLEAMIIDSDNEATFLILDFLDMQGPDLVKSVERKFGIELPDTPGRMADFLKVDVYARLFRSLYNSSYLNQNYSNYALNLLSRSNYKSGIRKPIPSSIKVAHKYGFMAYGPNQFQLNHVGLVYSPGKPYIIAVMTKGRSGEELRNTVSEISGLIFEEMSLETKDVKSRLESDLN